MPERSDEMKVIFRVNNPGFGLLHLREQDNIHRFSETEIDGFPSTIMLPLDCPLRDLSSLGFKKGDRIEVVLDPNKHLREILAIHRFDGELLWSK